MRTSPMSFKRMLRDAYCHREAGLDYLIKLAAMSDIIDLSGGGDPQDRPSEDNREEVKRLIQEVQDLIG